MAKHVPSVLTVDLGSQKQIPVKESAICRFRPARLSFTTLLPPATGHHARVPTPNQFAMGWFIGHSGYSQKLYIQRA